jgi:hypothetical protein
MALSVPAGLVEHAIFGEVETETLHAPALDSWEAQITKSPNTKPLKQGNCSIVVPRATGLRMTVS